MSGPNEEFWIRLARLNISYKYNKINCQNLLKDLEAECDLSQEYKWFLQQHSEDSLWFTITLETIKIVKIYEAMSLLVRKRHLQQLDELHKLYSNRIDSGKIDFYTIPDDILIKLFSTTFFLIFICLINGLSEFEKSQNEIKNKFLSICNTIVMEAFECELALRENDF